MSLKLPPTDSATRGLFDVRDLAAFGHPSNRTAPGTGFRDTLISSRDFLLRNPDVKLLHAFAFRANGDLWLVEITRKTWRRKWNFGK